MIKPRFKVSTGGFIDIINRSEPPMECGINKNIEKKQKEKYMIESCDIGSFLEKFERNIEKAEKSFEGQETQKVKMLR